MIDLFMKSSNPNFGYRIGSYNTFIFLKEVSALRNAVASIVQEIQVTKHGQQTLPMVKSISIFFSDILRGLCHGRERDAKLSHLSTLGLRMSTY
jgi:hypothetical protein